MSRKELMMVLAVGVFVCLFCTGLCHAEIYYMGFSGPFSVEEMETNLGPGWEAYVKEVQMDQTVTITNNLFPGTNTAYFEANDRIFGGVFRCNNNDDYFGKAVYVEQPFFEFWGAEWMMYWYPLYHKYWKYLGLCVYGKKRIPRGKYFGISIRPKGVGIPGGTKIKFRPNFLKVNKV